MDLLSILVQSPILMVDPKELNWSFLELRAPELEN